MSEEDELESELLHIVEGLTPLSALNADDVDSLTNRQQAFLICFINTGSLAQARKQAKVQSALYKKWLDNEVFAGMVEKIKNPTAFAFAMAQALVYKATLEHFQLFNHERTAVRQWAIERAYQLGGARKKEEEEQPGRLSQAEVKQIAERVGESVDARLNNRNPFSFVEGEVLSSEPIVGSAEVLEEDK